MLKIIGNPISVFSNKVRFVANALELDYDYVGLDLSKGEARTKEHKQFHPAGKIPVLIDDDFVLFESDAIIRYLADREGSALYPKELQERAIVDQWLQYVGTHLTSAFMKLFFNRYLAPARNFAIDEQSLVDGEKFLRRHLPVINEQLEKNPFLASNKITLADFNLLATIDPMDQVGIDLKPYPKILEHRNSLRTEAFYKKCFPEGFTLP